MSPQIPARFTVPGDAEFDSHFRMLRESTFPAREQFRYVAFAPTNLPWPIDWSHEREWRWPADSQLGHHNELFYLGLNGSHKCRIHAFVERDDDVVWLQQQVQTAFDTKQIGQVPLDDDTVETYYDNWSLEIPKVRILSLEQAQSRSDGQEVCRRFDDVDVASLPLLIRK